MAQPDGPERSAQCRRRPRCALRHVIDRHPPTLNCVRGQVSFFRWCCSDDCAVRLLAESIVRLLFEYDLARLTVAKRPRGNRVFFSRDQDSPL